MLGFVCVIEILRGTRSPGNAPDFNSSVLAVMTFVDLEVLVLLVSLFLALAPGVWGE